MAMVPAIATAFDPSRALENGNGLDLEAIHDFAIDIILRAGVLLRSHTWHRSSSSRHAEPSGPALGPSQIKDSQVDLVTEVDVKIEEFLRHEIQRAWPAHEIVAEESFGKEGGVKQAWRRGRGPSWFLDPLDGTLNATHLFPLHCISIGFACTHSTQAEVHDDALVGVIYAPSMGITGTVWSGARGRGAYLSHPTMLPQHVSTSTQVSHGCYLSELERSTGTGFVAGKVQTSAQRLPLLRGPLPHNAPSGILFASEWGKDRRRGENGQGNLARKMSTMTNMAAKDYIRPDASAPDGRYVHGVRSLGSSTLDLAFVAQGSIDVLWEGGCWEWDVCAGVALLLEAGGLLTDSNPPAASSSLWDGPALLPRAELGARRFLAVRACCSTPEETAVQAQCRVVREVWSRTDGLDYRRDGVHYAVEDTPSLHGDVSTAAKVTSSVRNWQDPLRERKRLSKEEAEALAASGASTPDADGTFGGRLLDEGKDPWQFNAWDHVEPPASYLAMIEDKLAVQAQTKLSPQDAAKFHNAPASYWNSFYSIHENRFFKDRRWLHLEFPELIAASKADAPPTRILEVGCGAGNTVFPLLETNQNPRLEIFACDYAPEAVNVVKSNPLYVHPRCGACTASVWDLSAATDDGRPSVPAEIEAHSLDIVVLIFVLSALHPNEWARAMANVRHTLKPGGLVLVRDYGRHDLPQLRFGKGRMIEENFYVRGDGTRVYFFTPNEFLSIFNASEPKDDDNKADDGSQDVAQDDRSPMAKDFDTLQLAIDRRMLLNRKEKKQMFRHWLQAKFRYTPSAVQ